MSSDLINNSNDVILVTGSNGFIGVRVVENLLARGHFNLKCFVRPSSRLERLNETIGRYPGAAGRVKIVSGDLLSRDDCRKAAEGVAIMLHLAAGFDKSFAGAFMNSALATRNLLDAFLEHGLPKRFVNVSSFAVYSNLKLGRRAVLDESCALEQDSQERGDAYGFGKLKQEEIVREYGQKCQLPYVILRPGAVFGPGKKDPSGRVGINTFGFFVHLGGSNPLPLTFVDNCAEAIVLAGIRAGVDGETFNVVDDELPSSREFFRAYRSRVRLPFAVSVPFFVTKRLCQLWERYSKWSKGQLPPVFNRRRCVAEWGGNRYSNRKLRERLGWSPKVPMNQAMAAYLSQFDEA